MRLVGVGFGVRSAERLRRGSAERFVPDRLTKNIPKNILISNNRGEVEKWRSGEVSDRDSQIFSKSISSCQYPKYHIDNHRSAELTPKPPKSNNLPNI
jgi:hypothetical protein